MRILFLTKNKPFSEDAIELVKLHFDNHELIVGNVDEPFPEHLLDKSFDYVISYVSPWIIPKRVLDNTKIGAINFHPGTPEYPGIGCTNFAIYNGEKTFGVTLHHMCEKVDTGEIIQIERFPVFKNDTVYTLTQRCYAYMYIMFVNLVFSINSGNPLPKSNENWKRLPYTRKELNDLCVINKDMSAEEIKRRIKATDYPNMPGAFIVLGGKKFLY